MFNLCKIGVRLALLVWALGCGNESDDGATVTTLTLTSLLAPTPIVAGTPVVAVGSGLEAVSEHARLHLEGDLAESVVALRNPQTTRIEFILTAEVVEKLGFGTRSVHAWVEDSDDQNNVRQSNKIAVTFEIAPELTPTLASPPSGNVHRNDVVVVRGDGFLFPTEGSVELVARGTFTSASGSENIEARLPVLPVEPHDRTRASVQLGTELGGIAVGTFEGSVSLESNTASGKTAQSDTFSTTLTFEPAIFFELNPSTVSLEQVATVRGAGFVGGPDHPDEGMFVRLRGTFEPFGGTPVALNDSELVLEWVNGTEARVTVESKQTGLALVSKVFGAARGRFDGTALAVTVKGANTVPGIEAPLSIELGPIVQVVHLKFLPGFYDSLSRYGLTAAAGVLEDLVVERIEQIYERWNVDVRLEQPDDYSVRGYASVEVGGPDPNDLGLFGYDNTPGKDIGNVRLADAIGGENAETQANNQPGYGGVFVDSFFYFSSHPDEALPQQLGPPPDPLFDEIFDPVRARPASLGEVSGEGDAARVSQVSRAVAALSSLIGETVAHELGHSFGLAEPYGAETVYHNIGDGDGCLMDSGSQRPFGERTQQPGFSPTRICYDSPSYLDQVFVLR